MSEFSCRNGHLIRSGERFCSLCGEPRYFMDGMTARQLSAIEQYEAELDAEREEDESRS